MRGAARLGSFAADATLLGRGRVVPVGRLVRLVVRALAPQKTSVSRKLEEPYIGSLVEEGDVSGDQTVEVILSTQPADTFRDR
ncbi:hypothetical protein E2C01_038406 [Portunus trituberculatus]|uniref:Uncharacterized protein n=1 Tax=Portunus trituberculatus TaxID=210409 RepID=A0A5B7FGQ7_PORTR|nr:hypothetical protein [Portunus trituberculatus]